MFLATKSFSNLSYNFYRVSFMFYVFMRIDTYYYYYYYYADDDDDAGQVSQRKSPSGQADSDSDPTSTGPTVRSCKK